MRHEMAQYAGCRGLRPLPGSKGRALGPVPVSQNFLYNRVGFSPARTV